MSGTTQPSSAGARSVVVAEATGLVGREFVTALLADASVSVVHALGRRPPAVEHPRLIPLIPANYRAVAASDVASALLARVPVARGREVPLSGTIQGAARQRRGAGRAAEEDRPAAPVGRMRS
jgi:hypothetical protein